MHRLDDVQQLLITIKTYPQKQEGGLSPFFSGQQVQKGPFQEKLFQKNKISVGHVQETDADIIGIFAYLRDLRCKRWANRPWSTVLVISS